MIISKILVPLLNANEPEARVVKIFAFEGQAVKAGEILFTIETTKAASDIESPTSGIMRLFVKEGDTLSVGDTLAVLTETVYEIVTIPSGEEKQSHQKRNPARKKELSEERPRITKPARILAESLGVDISILPVDKLITEEVIRQIVGHNEQPKIDFHPTEKEYLIIFGGGGHAKTVIDLIRRLDKYSIAGIVDDNRALVGGRILDVPVLGTRAILPAILTGGVKFAVNCVGGILDINIRVQIFDLLERNGFTSPSLIHPRASVETSATIGSGVQVFCNAYIGSDTKLYPMCMINTSSVISHDCVIGRYTHIAPGALLAGHVQVGEKSLVGMGVTTAIGVKIGSGVRIGNGAIILADVPDKTIVQAGRFWTGKAE